MLRPDTQALWDLLRQEPALGGFVLIGGTALSLHLGHRVSEDLDFAFDGPKLPRLRIEALSSERAEYFKLSRTRAIDDDMLRRLVREVDLMETSLMRGPPVH